MQRDLLFPAADNASNTPTPGKKITQLMKKSIDFPRSTNTSITKATIIRSTKIISSCS